jgi:hypothetical protein
MRNFRGISFLRFLSELCGDGGTTRAVQWAACGSVAQQPDSKPSSVPLTDSNILNNCGPLHGRKSTGV